MTEEEAIEQDAAELGEEPADLAWQLEFEDAATALQEKYPAEFAYSKIDKDAGTAEVAFKGEAPAEAFSTLKGAADVMENVGYSEAELNADVAAVLRVVQKHAVDVGNGMAAADIENHTIDVLFDDVHADIGTTARQRTRSIEEIEQKVLEETDPQTGFSVQVDFSPDPVVEQEAFDGGWGIAVGGSVACTMAFPIKKGTAAGLRALTGA